MASCASSAFGSGPWRFSAGKQRWKKAGAGVVAAGGGLAAAALVGAHVQSPCASSAPWHFLPLACLAPPPPPSSVTEPSSGVSFPSSIAGALYPQQLAGTGLRKKSIFGLKNVTIYAFGVYADEVSLKDKLGSKYAPQSGANLQENKSFYDDIVASDFELTVRLVIVYGRLKISSVRSAFEESIGNRIKKFSGSEDRPLLDSFTSLFKDDIKLPRGTTIDITRRHGHILTTKVNDEELGSVRSPLLCRSFMDLYIGEDPFDTKGKEDIGSKLAATINS